MADHVVFDVTFEFKNGATWVDFSDDVLIKSVVIDRGSKGYGPSSRMATPGKATFNVKNGDHNSAGLEGYYTPLHVNCRTGWEQDAEVRIRFTADGIRYTKFKGYLRNVLPAGDIVGDEAVVTLEDQLYKLRKKMELPALARNKTMDEGVALVLENYNVEPEGGIATEGTMSKTFPTFFDITPKDAAGLTELAQIAGSALGFIGLVGDIDTGEKLLLQARDARATASVAVVPVGNQNADRLVDYSGNQLVDYEGNILVGMSVQTVDITDRDKSVQHGENVINRARVKITPRRENESLQVLFQLDDSPALEPGESMTFLSAYKDPDSEATEIAAYSMQSPIAWVDYSANTQQDGEGEDRTAYLLVSPPDYGVKEVENTIENTHPTDTIYPELHNRGYGVYFFRPVEVVSENIDGETYEMGFSLAYIADVAEAQGIADDIVAALKDPRVEVPALEFDLEHSWANYWAAIWLEMGMKIPIVDSRYGVDGYAYVQGYTIRESNGMWNCRLVLASEAVSTI